MKFIQLCGAGRAGKSTIASILYDVAYENNYIPVILPFAKALKKEAADLGFTKEKDPEGYRKYCQKWGEGRRKEDPDYWVSKVREEVESLKEMELRNKQDNVDRFEHIIIQDDVRYMNEIAFGREMEAYQIFITTGDRDIAEPFDSWRFHESESLATMVEMGHRDYVDIFHEFLVNRDPVPELQDYIRDRFFTWIMGEDPSTDPTTELYRNGLLPNDHFLKLFMLKDELDKLDNIVDLIEDEIERLEDEETDNSDY